MKLDDIENGNRAATAAAATFRKAVTPENLGAINQDFHKHKNHFPYFGFIPVQVEGEEFAMFSSNDDLVAMTFFWYGADSYEPMSMSLWCEHSRKARTILDVGSFSGIYSLAATRNPQARIHAVEAARRTYGRLLVNLQINRLSNRITCSNVAISSGDGFETFLRFRGENILGIGDSFISKKLEVQGAEERVQTISLDQLCADHELAPDLIKLDVEGAECLALAGMTRILEQNRPNILIEVTPDTAAAAAAELSRHGYVLQLVDERHRTVTPFTGQTGKVANLWATPA